MFASILFTLFCLWLMAKAFMWMGTNLKRREVL